MRRRRPGRVSYCTRGQGTLKSEKNSVLENNFLFFGPFWNQEGAPAERDTAREAGELLKSEKNSVLENNFFFLKSEKNSALENNF